MTTSEYSIPLPTKHSFQDLTHRVFGRYTVLAYAGVIKNKTSWTCKCECGIVKIVAGKSLKDGTTKSCGCWQKDFPPGTTHGCWALPEYNSWYSARRRCECPTDAGYKRYGARGIKFRLESAQTIVDAIGHRPSPEYSLDRINNDGHYEVGNIRWATAKEQMNNTGVIRRITFEGETLTVLEWAKKLQMSKYTIGQRYTRGYCPDCCLNPTPRLRCTHKIAQNEMNGGKYVT